MSSIVRLAASLAKTDILGVFCRRLCDLVCELVERELGKVIVHGRVHNMVIETRGCSVPHDLLRSIVFLEDLLFTFL